MNLFKYLFASDILTKILIFNNILKSEILNIKRSSSKLGKINVSTLIKFLNLNYTEAMIISNNYKHS